MLAPLGVSTGDGRRFLPAGVTHRELPLPLRWQREDDEGHDMSVIVGVVDEIDIGAAEVWARGELFDDVDPAVMPRLTEDVAEAMMLTDKGVIGPSVDAGAATVVLAEVGADEPLTEERFEELWEQAERDGEDVAVEMLFTTYEIAAATLVPVPAFAQCRPFELEQPAVTGAVRATGWADLPLADREYAWNGADAAGRVAADCGIGGDEPDWDCYAAAFLYRDPDANAQTRGAYGFGIVDVVEGTRMIVPRGVFAVAASLRGARGGPSIPEDDQARMREVVAGLYGRMRGEWDDDSIVPPWGEDSAALVRTLTAAAPAPPAEAFTDPQLEELTPLTIVDMPGGWQRVVGHVATHDTCHVGIPGGCVTAPASQRGYAPFHRYRHTASGVELPVAAGRITTGHGTTAARCGCCRGNDDHACTQLTAAGAMAHHDRMPVVAYVVAGEDARHNAIWVSGIPAPEATAADLAVLSRRRVSGDWRDVGGHLELVEVLALHREQPGFPLPAARLDGDRRMALTAAGAVMVRSASGVGGDGLDVEVLADRIAARLAALGVAPPAAVRPAPVVPAVVPSEVPAPDEAEGVSGDPQPEQEVVARLAAEVHDVITGAHMRELADTVEAVTRV